MSALVNPLTFTDLFGAKHVEPSVTGTIDVQTVEPILSSNVNDLIIVSPYRSGKPNELNFFRSLASFRDNHDPDRNEDEGVALAQVARSGFADRDVYGAASLGSVRVDAATQSAVDLLTGSTTLITVTTSDYGSHTTNRSCVVASGTNVGKKVTLTDYDNTARTYIGDDLGVLISGFQYTGDAGVALATLRMSIGTVTYTDQPTDGDLITVTSGNTRKVYEFDSAAVADVGDVAVTIGASADATWEAFRAAVEANNDQLDSVALNSTTDVVTITAVRGGVVIEETLDQGSKFSVAHSGVGARLLGEIGGKVSYTGQPADTDTVVIQGTTFEFDNDTSVTAGNVSVTIGVDEDTTYANLVAAILANLSNVMAYQVAASNVVNVVSTTVAVTVTGTPTNATTTTGQTDGSLGFNLELAAMGYKTLQLLAGNINGRTGWTCSVGAYANKFLASVGLDVVSQSDVKTASITMTGYVAAIVDWINTSTKSQYTAVEVARGEPSAASYIFAGGTTPAVTATGWTNALDTIANGVEEGAILLINTDDATIMAAVVTWIEEQHVAGKWFRAYFGLASGATVQTNLDLVAALNHSRVRVCCQRPGVYQSDGSLEYLHPVYLAAALAGGASGNLPYDKPLTNKRLRFAAFHEDDLYSLKDREELLGGGITVVKDELDEYRVALNVTTSRDPDRRMVRIVSEIDTVDLADARMRRAYMQFRGKWASGNVAARVTGVMRRVLDPMTQEGAFTPGVDDYGNAVAAWTGKAIGPNGETWSINQGVLSVGYQVYVPGELNHVSLQGAADYQRIVGTISGSTADVTTSVPVR